VLVFLGILIVIDSYKLVSLTSVIGACLAGAAAALACLVLNGALLELHVWGPESRLFTRYVAPVVEETVKGLYVVLLLRRRRVGFLVDAAIYGFAVGAGFGVAENIHYLRHVGDPGLWLWIIRGFGTAIMHGSATALFAILGKGMADRRESLAPWIFLPGLGTAVLVHSLYNHFLLPPVVTTAVLLVVLPSLVLAVYARSERATRQWLGLGFDTDVEVLESILSGEVRNTRLGRYLESLRSTFPGPVVADMLCLLRVHMELAIRAKGILLAREAGLRVEVDEQVAENLRELAFLEKAVGKTGRLALHPFLARTSRDVWQLTMLGK
jgi:RsiW-degrading membrane proteinase PrsW (M82 family)